MKKRIRIRLLDWLYPPRCPVCHDIIVPKGHPACPACMERIQPVTEPRCKKCSKQIDNSEAEYCYDCHHTTHHFDQGIGIFPYNSLWKQSITQFKYHGRREYGKFYGTLMAFYGQHMIQNWKPDVIIPVPIHRSRMQKRGYNQALELAKEIQRQTGIAIDKQLVRRTGYTTPQKELSRKQRKENLRKAFSVDENRKNYKTVLIIDDIYTTGSTVDAIAYLLKKKGVKKVYFLSLCVGGGF